MVSPNSKSPPMLHIGAFSPISLWWRLLREFGGVSPGYRTRLAGIVAASAMTSPLRLAERVCHGRRITRTRIEHPPVYIQGFARTGTTHLHNLMARDPQFGFASTFQVFAGPFFLVAQGWLDRLISKGLPATRPMDNVALGLNLPQEEDVLLATVSHMSLTHSLTFPSRIREILRRYHQMELSEDELAEWKREYLRVLKRVSLACGGKRLVLKSPANLGRTAILQELLPGSRFIFIQRNPYVVYSSAMHTMRSMLPGMSLQPADWDEVEAATLDNYVAVMRRYMRDREQVPKGMLTEIRYEDLVADPLAVLKEAYDAVRLPWDQAEGPIKEYVGALTGYKTNRYRLDQATIDKVTTAWGFAVREWGYEPPEPRLHNLTAAGASTHARGRDGNDDAANR